MLQPTTNESNEVLPTRSTDEPCPVVIPDSTSAVPTPPPSKMINTCFKSLAVLAFIYGLSITAAGISIGSPRYTGILFIYWVVSTLSSWVVLLLGMWSAQSTGRLYVWFFRCVLLGLHGFHLWNGLSILDKNPEYSDVRWTIGFEVYAFFGCSIDTLYVSVTANLKHPKHPAGRLGDSDQEPTERAGTYKMSRPPPQNTRNLQTWFSRMTHGNQHQGLLESNLRSSNSQEKLLILDNSDAV